MIAETFIREGHPKKRVLSILDIARSSYYYRPVDEPQKRGIAKSEYTELRIGERITNEQVVSEIETLLEKEFVDYGYLKVTYWLRQHRECIINPKKTYRLMSESELLNKVVRRKKGSRNWVKELLPPAKKAFDYLEFDIKYFYVWGEKRNALLLTVIDVHTRWVMGHYMAWSIKHPQVVALFKQIFEVYPLPSHFFVRNDNGSQFIAENVRKCFEERGVTQEFCKPATPQQNAHIESYHSIQESVICQKYEFDSLKDAQQTLNRFVYFYNFERIHSGCNYYNPFYQLEKNSVAIDSKHLEFVLDSASTKLFFSN